MILVRSLFLFTLQAKNLTLGLLGHGAKIGLPLPHKNNPIIDR